MRRLAALQQLAIPVLLLVAVGVAGNFFSRSIEIYFRNSLVMVAVVAALYVFVGNSGVVSFGQVSFVAVGAFAAGVTTVPADVKPAALPDAFALIRDHSLGNVESLLLATICGGIFAFLIGAPLMRLSGLAAGIATFAVLEITHNILRYWTKIGPGAGLLSLVPETTGLLQGTLGAIAVVGVADAPHRRVVDDAAASRRKLTGFTIRQHAPVLDSLKKTRSDRVHADPRGIFLGHVHGQPLGEIANARLSRRITHHAGQRTQSGHGGDVEDNSLSLLRHPPAKHLARQDGSEDVQVHDAAQCILRQVKERTLRRSDGVGFVAACAVDQAIDSAKGLDGLLAGLFQRLGL